MAKIGGYLVHEAAKLFPLLAGSEFERLREDIREKGQLEPAVLWKAPGGREVLLDGRNRVRACEAEDIQPRYIRYEGDDPTGFVVSHNLRRRHLNESQRSMVGARLAQVLEEDAKRGRPKKGEEKGGRRLPVRDRVARMVNVSGASVQKALKVLQHGAPELAGAVDTGILRVDVAAPLADKPKPEQRKLITKIAAEPKKNARAIVRQHDRDQTSARIDAEGEELPDGPFSVLVADPPWPYQKRAGDGTQRGQTPYPTMALEDIVEWAKKLRDIAADDAVLWLWCTNAHMVSGDQVAVLEASGFTGKTILSWDKDRMGTGDWLRGQTEHCILAVRGKPTVKLKGHTTLLDADSDVQEWARELWRVHSDELGGRDGFVKVVSRAVSRFLAPGTVVPMITEARRREHSRKPEAFYGFVESLCPGNKVELFSRTDRQGWASWGAEAGTFEAELGL